MNPDLLQNPLVEYILEFLLKQAIEQGPEIARKKWNRIKRTRTKQAHTPRITLIDREKELRSIKTILKESPHLRILYFIGEGGVGKTRLLEEARHLPNVVTASFRIRWGGILDLYHTELHSVSALQADIVHKLDPELRYFRDFRSAQDRFDRLLAEGMTGPALETVHHKLNDLFFKEYKAFAEIHRPIIAFDTLESLSHESDWVESLCRLEGVTVAVREWLIGHMTRLENSVILLAGRPQPDLQRTLAKVNGEHPGQMETIEINGLTREDARQFLALLLKDAPPSLKPLTASADLLWQLTRGLPVQLALAVELASQGEYVVQEDTGFEGNVELWGQRLVSTLFSYDHPARRIFFFLALARKGLTADLLHYLEPDWSLENCRRKLERLQTSSIVKTRPENAAFFLHDALYELFDAYFPENVSLESWYERLADYYRAEKIVLGTHNNQRRDVEINLLYYELRRSPRQAFESVYLRIREGAIAGHELELDLQLRDELLRCFARRADHHDLSLKALPQAEIDRDGAVRWIKRFIIQANYQQAILVAETIFALGPQPYPMFIPDSVAQLTGLTLDQQNHAREILDEAGPLFWGQLLTYYGEALIHTGASEHKVCQIIEKAIVLLEDVFLGIDHPLNWLRKRVAGRANHEMGYLMRSYGHYGRAFKAYEGALQEFGSIGIDEIFDEQANTLTNMAFVLAHLGASIRAKAHVDQALEMSQRLGKKYPLALSHNTRGLIYGLRGQYEIGRRESQLALSIFEELDTPRGIGLACNALGYILRKQGESWKSGKISQSKAIQCFQQSINYLARAEKVFSEDVSEPIRLWEAYNEQGSLYRAWGCFLMEQRESDSAQELYSKAVSYQLKALEVAQQHKMHFQEADTCDDLAGISCDQDDHIKAFHWLKQALSLVPDEFKLIPDKRNQLVPVPGEAYWLILGKAYLQQGILAINTNTKDGLPEKKQHEYTELAIKNFALAAYYFEQYWPGTSTYLKRLHLMGDLISKLRLPVREARKVIKEIAIRYNINVSAFLGVLDNRSLG